MTTAAPRRKFPSWFPQAVGYCLSAACLAWVLHGYQFNELIPAIKTLDWWWVSAAVLCDLSVYVVHGWPEYRSASWRNCGLAARPSVPVTSLPGRAQPATLGDPSESDPDPIER